MTVANKPVWLITGANKVLGLAVAKEALNRGFCVVAGARRVEQIHTVLDAGIRAVGGGSVYSASKFAIEGWTEGLAMELAPFGIRCLIAEPGPFRTDFSNEKASMVFADKKFDAYQADREKLEAVSHDLNGNQPGDPAKFAKALMTVIHDDRPPLRLVCGKDSVKGIGDYLTTRQAEVEAWRNLSESTYF